MEKIIGIIGGMGPMATLDLYGKIIVHTKATCDQDHPHVIIDSNTQIPDRTAYILGSGETPIPQLVRSAKNLARLGANVFLMPCNTAHYFYNEIYEALTDTIKSKDFIFINMIEEAAKEIKKIGSKSALLLATDGTFQSKIYQRVFSDFNIEIIGPEEEIQRKVMSMIYAYKSGQRQFDVNFLKSIIEQAITMNYGPVILGCTELPLIFKLYQLEDQVIDPTEILALAALKQL